jgi:hypothetical protein
MKKKAKRIKNNYMLNKIMKFAIPAMIAAAVAGCASMFYKDEASLVKLANNAGKATGYVISINEKFVKNGPEIKAKVTEALGKVLETLPKDVTYSNVLDYISETVTAYVTAKVTNEDQKKLVLAAAQMADTAMKVGLGYVEKKNPTLLQNGQCVYNVSYAFLDATYQVLKAGTTSLALAAPKSKEETKVFNDILDANGIK